VPSAPASPAETWRATAREFAERHLAPIAAEVDRTDALPPDLRPKMREAGFFGLGLPSAWGGRDGDLQSTAAVLEELAVHSAAVATLLAVHLSVAAKPILQAGTDAQRETYLRPLAEGRWLGAFGLTEPGAGSDAARLTTRYRAVDGGFRLTGSKMFITNAASADLLLVFATRDPQLERRGISAFLLRKGASGFSIAQHLDKLGLRGSETSELVLEEAHVASDGLLGTEGHGLAVALGALTGGRVGIGACALGVARAALEEMERLAAGSTDPGTRAAVGRAYVEVAAARALVTAAARERDEGRGAAESASAAKLFASQAAVRTAAAAVDLAGWPGVQSGARAERLWRDARVFPIVEGTTEIQELILGRTLLER
jgi:alkylation response protein AidB-like acyl-CoA dehydrogenase